MNLGDVVKKEIIERPIKESHCQKAFLAGVFRGAGSLYSDNGEIGLAIRLSDENTALLISLYLYELYRYEIREVSCNKNNFDKKDRYDIFLNGDLATTILLDLEIMKTVDGELSVNFGFFGKIVAQECCFRAFLRGLFIASGRCTVPTEINVSTGYYLEMVFSRAETADGFSDRMAKSGFVFNVMRRKETFVAYMKNVENIKDFLAFLAVPVSVLKLTNIIIERELINDSNRKKNCDLGNIGRQLDAIEKQITAINSIKSKWGLNKLKDDLKTVAEARINNPDESLSELAEKLGITKSCINHRMRKILLIAQENN